MSNEKLLSVIKNSYKVKTRPSINVTVNGVAKAFLTDFHHRFIYFEGALGLGKTYTTILKMLAIARNQKPLPYYDSETGKTEFIRPTRILVTRKNYSQLIDGIFRDAKSFVEQMSHKVYTIKESTNPHPVIHIKARQTDGTIVDSMWIFKAIEFEADLDKIHGIALTCAIMDEGNEQEEYVFSRLSQRVLRYPSANANDFSEDIVNKLFGKQSVEEGETIIDQYLKDSLEKNPTDSRHRKIEKILNVAQNDETSLDDEDVINLDSYKEEIETGGHSTDTITWGGIIVTANPPDTLNWVYRRLISDRIKCDRRGVNISVYYRLPPVFHRSKEQLAITENQIQFQHNEWFYQTNPNAEGIKYNSAGIDYWIQGVQAMGKNDKEIQRMYLGYHTSRSRGEAIFKNQFIRSLHVIPQYEVKFDSTRIINWFFDYGVNSACTVWQTNSKGGLSIKKVLYLPDSDFQTFLSTTIKPFIYENGLDTYGHYVDGDSTGRNNLGSSAGSYLDMAAKLFKSISDRVRIGTATIPDPLKRIGATRQLMAVIGGLEIPEEETDTINGFEFGYVEDPRTGKPDKKDKIIVENNIRYKQFNYTHIMDTICDSCYVLYYKRAMVSKNDTWVHESVMKTMRTQLEKEHQERRLNNGAVGYNSNEIFNM